MSKDVFCKFLMPCGYCELKKVECNKFKTTPTITYPIGGGLMQTPYFAPEDIKVGDWPPGPQPTCKDLASNPDTFRVHFDDLPKYNSSMSTASGTYNPNITATAKMKSFDINSVKQSLENGK